MTKLVKKQKKQEELLQGLTLLKQKYATRKRETETVASLPDESEIALALVEAEGLLTKAAGLLGVTPGWLRDAIELSPELQRLKWEIDQVFVDIAEARLRRRVVAGDWRAVEYLLDNKAQERGYGKRKETASAEVALSFVKLVRESTND